MCVPQTFLSELYVYLVDQMHVALGKVLAVEDQPPIPEPLTDSQQLKHFAAEAEANGNYDLAIKYYQEVSKVENLVKKLFLYNSLCDLHGQGMLFVDILNIKA